MSDIVILLPGMSGPTATLLYDLVCSDNSNIQRTCQIEEMYRYLLVSYSKFLQ